MADERTVKDNVRVLLPIVVLQTVFYTSMNQLQWLPARKLPLTAVDQAVPFLPWTVVPYMLLIFGGALPAFFTRHMVTLKRAIVAYVICLLIAGPIFLFFPTHCPRPDLATLGNTWGETAYRYLTKVDTPACAFPSFHIILPTICCWIGLYERQRFAVVFSVVMALLSVTILTTKQHYFWDLLGGFGIACAGILIACRWIPNSSEECGQL